MRGLAQQAWTDERGITVIEVMVAIVVLLVGVLGTLVMLQGGARSTSRTTAREQATNLARDVLERSRQTDYANVTKAGAAATLRALLPASDAATALSGSTFQVTRRNNTYTVSIYACSIDDPTDGAGVGDPTFCAAPATVTVPGTPPTYAASVNVLGIAVTAGGSLLNTVCGALGVSSILSQLTAAVSAVAPISVCPSALGGGTVQYDVTPDDLRRVRVDVAWNRGGAGSLTQTTLLTNPR